METPNLDYIHAVAKGDDSFVKEILTVILEELPKEQSLYCKCIEDSNWQNAASLVHKIKHKFTIVGLVQGAAVANEHEKHLQMNSPEYHGQFNDLINLVRTFIQSYTNL